MPRCWLWHIFTKPSDVTSPRPSATFAHTPAPCRLLTAAIIAFIRSGTFSISATSACPQYWGGQVRTAWKDLQKHMDHTHPIAFPSRLLFFCIGSHPGGQMPIYASGAYGRSANERA
mmetsp:Transcript_11657/g.36141  ORF Transcript_11657/g.36141 Transcript_11657/m.36141 type:complete len:117 (-) Transcript_11657:541-891(-)